LATKTAYIREIANVYRNSIPNGGSDTAKLLRNRELLLLLLSCLLAVLFQLTATVTEMAK